MTDFLDLSDVDLATVLQKYSAQKGWFVRHVKKLNSLQSVVHKDYDRDFVQDFEQELREAERQVSSMQQLTDWLEQAEYDKLEAYKTECTDNEGIVETFFENITKIRKKNLAKAPPETAPVTRQPEVKPMSDLKPELLQTDSSTTDVAQWKRG